jgi:hypothetical protein
MLGIDELEILEELVHGACAPAQQQDDGGFVDVKGRDWAAIGGSDDVDEGAALGFFLQDGDEGGGIDDDQSKTPRSL